MQASARDEARVLSRVERRLYIDGKWRDAAGAKTLTVEDPATGVTIAEVADAGRADAARHLRQPMRRSGRGAT